MRLQSLRLQGFKSFADSTRIDFREGLTAIVGSNGCGKSNIADSIRWVLGEQRARVMRGAKMEEVIFQGTARRRALNFAEVTLHFDNQSGRVPVPQTELELSRKVFREGGSEYALNRTACRLRDVQNLLRDTGLGSNAYAIIESTMIETLLSDRAEERRSLFEEAAGIGRYKDSRHAAMRRLEAAEGDLLRLDDLIAEVEAKVRSLGRQKRRAERQEELRQLRLELEVAIARTEWIRLQAAVEQGEGTRAALAEQERIVLGERSVAESHLEERRLEASALATQRAERAARLEALRNDLHAREREILLADERRSHAEQRLERLVSERLALLERIERSAEQCARAEVDLARWTEQLEGTREGARVRLQENEQIRVALGAERAHAEESTREARRLAGEQALVEAERAAAELRRSEAREAIAALAEQADQIHEQLARMLDQTELWEAQAEEVAERAESAREILALAREEHRVLRNREQQARDDARAAEDRASTLSAQLLARESLETSYEGFAAAVAAIMQERERFQGVHAPLADYLESSGDALHARGIEHFLGPLLQALVVDDLTVVRRLRQWFREEWSGGGALWLLPLSALEGSGSRAGADPVAALWAEALIGKVAASEDDILDRWSPGWIMVGEGEVIDARGIVRLLEPNQGQGILARREALAELRLHLAAAHAEREAGIERRDELRHRLSEAEEDALELEERVRVTEAQLKAIELDAAAHRDRKSRLAHEHATITARLEEARRAEQLAATTLERTAARLIELAEGAVAATTEEERSRARLAELEANWEEARDEETELRVALARAESEVREAGRIRDSARQSRAGGEARLRAIDTEAREIRDSIEVNAGSRIDAELGLKALFDRRDQEQAGLTLVEARLAEVDSELAELGERGRLLRRKEEESAKERHEIELRLAEARSRLERVRERIEIEWATPWEVLLAETSAPVDGDVESWQAEAHEVARQLQALGPVNMLAIEEHDEESRRLEFLLGQRHDLTEAKENLVRAIRQINRTAREVFQATFDTVRENFQRTFQSLFQGGECDVWLTDPDDPLESMIEIQASPVGKKTQRIHLLSGGERTLTALALLFGLYLVKPSPFCVLDEIDAPLDESNVGRFIQLLNDFKAETQFIVITHNPRTMEAADWVYGVTMEEPGVSSIVSVELMGIFAEEESEFVPGT